jgi:hypothetical protein
MLVCKTKPSYPRDGSAQKKSCETKPISARVELQLSFLGEWSYVISARGIGSAKRTQFAVATAAGRSAFPAGLACKTNPIPGRQGARHSSPTPIVQNKANLSRLRARKRGGVAVVLKFRKSCTQQCCWAGCEPAPPAWAPAAAITAYTKGLCRNVGEAPCDALQGNMVELLKKIAAPAESCIDQMSGYPFCVGHALCIRHSRKDRYETCGTSHPYLPGLVPAALRVLKIRAPQQRKPGPAATYST